jgi:acetoin utilization protein AcuC
MSERVLVIEDPALAAYVFGPSHPLAPVRVELTMALARALGVLDAVTVEPAPVASDAQIELVHDRDYVEAVRRAGTAPLCADLARQLGTPDNPVFEGMHEASARVVGASVRCAEAVLSGEVEHAVNVYGGLHHAMRGHAWGFCVYNDPAVAIARMLELGARRIAYVDVDVHHGDGVEAAFRDDDRVLTISLHESGRYLFPGTGFPDPDHPLSVNVPLEMGTGDADWHDAFESVVPGELAAFRPEVLVSQHGCDSHMLDPLAHLALTVDGQGAAAVRLHDLAHELCGGRWVALGGGGYERAQVVPRAWTHLLAVAAGRPVDPSTPTPEEWRALVTRLTGELPPTRMGDLVAPSSPGVT